MAVTSRDLHSTAPLRRHSTARVALPTRSVNSLAYVVVLLFVVAAAGALYSSLSAWVQVKLDDMHYGRPRTVQLSAYVGHGEDTGLPTHLVAMNLDRRVVVIEMPGGDASKSRTLVGPYLFGAGEDLTPVKLRLADVNGDTHQDLIVSVKSEEMIYINENSNFRIITPEERQQVQAEGY
jgi:hypothetical protein